MHIKAITKVNAQLGEFTLCNLLAVLEMFNGCWKAFMWNNREPLYPGASLQRLAAKTSIAMVHLLITRIL